jgi:small GTP-binding protein
VSTVQKKICMIGDFSVGKTSLVSRFVKQAFSDKYLTTVGVKIDTKMVAISAEKNVKLILWDIAGNDGLTTTTTSYLRGAAGYLLVVDGTRRPTWNSALNLQQAVAAEIGEKPFILLLNKADLINEWELDTALIETQRAKGWTILMTSAKTGDHVEESFLHLAMAVL